MPVVINSYAKLNLYLAVLARRRDNYHDIHTLFERISLSDKIILKPRTDKKIKIACSDRGVPQGRLNLCWRSARLLQDACRVKSGADIRIVKRIPQAAGLGGGSSNAAAVLLGLNRLWRLNLAQPKLAKLARRIGSDAPFFIYGVPFAQGQGRGDRIRPIAALKRVKLWHVLVVPRLKVSTPAIYKKWDEIAGSNLEKAGLTKSVSDVKIITLALKKQGAFAKGGFLFNGLEGLTMGRYPQVRRIKEELAGLGLKSVLMSGSGPAVFGIAPSKKEALRLAGKLRRSNSRWRVFCVSTQGSNSPR